MAVLGAGGIIAPAIVRDLAESGEAAELHAQFAGAGLLERRNCRIRVEEGVAR